MLAPHGPYRKDNYVKLTNRLDEIWSEISDACRGQLLLAFKAAGEFHREMTDPGSTSQERADAQAHAKATAKAYRDLQKQEQAKRQAEIDSLNNQIDEYEDYLSDYWYNEWSDIFAVRTGIYYDFEFVSFYNLD